MNAEPVLWQPPVFLDDVSDMDIWNSFVSWDGHSLPLAFEGSSVSFNIVDELKTPSLGFVLQGKHGLRFYVSPQVFPFKALFDIELSALEVQGLPDAVRDALNQGMANMLWNAIPNNPLGEFEIIDTGSFSTISEFLFPEGSGYEWLSFQFHGLAPEPMTFLIAAKSTDILKVFEEYGGIDNDIIPPLAGRLTTQAFYSLGSLSITENEWTSLAPGAFIVLPEIKEDVVLVRSDWNTYIFRQSEEEGYWVCEERHIGERYRVSSVESIGQVPEQDF